MFEESKREPYPKVLAILILKKNSEPYLGYQNFITYKIEDHMFSLKTDTHTTLAFYLSSVTRAIASFEQEPLCNHLECHSCWATKTHHGYYHCA
jgi:hypothetical protein